MELEKVLGELLAQDPSTSPQNNPPQTTPGYSHLQPQLRYQLS